MLKFTSNSPHTVKRRRGEVPEVPSFVDMEIRFLGTEQADVVEHLPSAERANGKTVRYVARDIIEAYKVLKLLTHAAPKLYPYSYSSY